MTERARHLWVLQERGLVVRAASAAVQQRLRIFGPAAKVHLLVPRLMNTDHRCIDQTADIRVREELAPVCEGHPADFKENAVSGPREESTVLTKKVRFHVNSPELAVIFNCDAKVSSLSVADLCPLFRAEERKAKQFKNILMTLHTPNELF